MPETFYDVIFADSNPGCSVLKRHHQLLYKILIGTY